MNDNATAATSRVTLLRTLATRLTRVAYPIAARHGMKLFWVDLAIDLWTALDDRVKRLEWELERAGWPGDFEAWLERLAAELTDAAYRITLQYGALGSFLELELGLYHAFCQAVNDIGRETMLCPILVEVGLRGTIRAHPG
jgi:hypothetical protein